MCCVLYFSTSLARSLCLSTALSLSLSESLDNECLDCVSNFASLALSSQQRCNLSFCRCSYSLCVCMCVRMIVCLCVVVTDWAAKVSR